MKSCCICEFNKIVEVHHLISGNEKYLVLLCPNHHRMIHNKIYRVELLEKLLQQDIISRDLFEQIMTLDRDRILSRKKMLENLDLSKEFLPLELFSNRQGIIEYLDSLSNDDFDKIAKLFNEKFSKNALDEYKKKWE